MSDRRDPKDNPGCLFGWLFGGGGRRGGAAPDAAAYPYAARHFLLSKAERSFYGVLCSVCHGRFDVFAKVRLADLLFVERGAERRQHHQNRIQMKHVDFVLCDPEAVRPLLVIELDDASHERAARQERDEFVDRALMAAGVPILHVKVAHAYVARELDDAIQRAIGTS